MTLMMSIDRAGVNSRRNLTMGTRHGVVLSASPRAARAAAA
jgi:hypothetical protein